MKYYSFIKRKKILLFAPTWMNPEGILSKISRRKQTLYDLGYIWDRKTEL